MADLPKIAMRRLQENGSATEVHPDPNLISAFAENSLPGDSRAQIMLHLAHCVDCREILFLSTPDAATLPVVASAPSRWLTWPVLRWGAAVAAVVVVVAAVSLHRQSGQVAKFSGSMQQTDIPIAKEKAADPIPGQKQEIAVLKNTAPVPSAKPDSLGDVEGKRPDRLKKQESRVAASPMLAQNGALSSTLTNERKSELEKSTTAEAAQAAAPSAVSSVAADQMVPGRAKDAANQPIPGGGIGGGTPLAPAASRPRAALLLPTVGPRWTVTSDGTLQRSFDFGRSWQTVRVASETSFRALAASGRDIWVGGSKGALYHSVDAGQTWVQVQPVNAGQMLTDDIIGVEFPDPLHGKLSTSTKQVWTTEDGGQNWHQE